MAYDLMVHNYLRLCTLAGLGLGLGEGFIYYANGGHFAGTP